MVESASGTLQSSTCRPARRSLPIKSCKILLYLLRLSQALICLQAESPMTSTITSASARSSRMAILKHFDKTLWSASTQYGEPRSFAEIKTCNSAPGQLLHKATYLTGTKPHGEQGSTTRTICSIAAHRLINTERRLIPCSDSCRVLERVRPMSAVHFTRDHLSMDLSAGSARNSSRMNTAA